MDNNCPVEPSIESVPLLLGEILTVMFWADVSASAPENTIFGSSSNDPMFG